MVNNLNFSQNLSQNLAQSLISALNPVASQATNIVDALSASFAPKDKTSTNDNDFSAAMADVGKKQSFESADKRPAKTAPRTKDGPDAAAIENPDTEKRGNLQSGATSAQAKDHIQPARNRTNDNAPLTADNVSQIQQQIEQVASQIATLEAQGELPPELQAMVDIFKNIMQTMLQLVQAAVPVQGGITNPGQQTSAEQQQFLNQVQPLLTQLGQLQSQLKQETEKLAITFPELFSGINDGDGLAATETSSDIPLPDESSSYHTALTSLLGKLQTMQKRLDQLSDQLAGKFDPALTQSDIQQNKPSTPLLTTIQQQADATDRQATSSSLATAEENIPTATVDASANNQTKTANTNNLQQQHISGVAAQSGGQSQNNSSFQQGGQQSGNSFTSQPSTSTVSGQAATSAATATKDAPSFDRMLQPQVRGSAVEQVQFQMKSLIQNGNSKMIVKLDPAEMGELEIRLETSRDGHSRMVVSVEKPQTLEMLQRDARSLLQTLADAGLKTDSGSLSFNLRGENGSGGGQQSRQSATYYPPVADDFDEDMLHVVSQDYTAEIQHGVNISV